MPLVTIKILEGCTEEQKNKMFETVTEAIAMSLNKPKDSIHIDVVDMARTNYAVAGVPKSKV